MEQQIGLQRVGVISRLPQILWELGVDPRDVFSAAGLPPASIADPNASISFDELDRLFSSGVSLSRCPHVALLVGNRSSLRFLGPVGELMRHAPTGRRALLARARRQHKSVAGNRSGD